MVEELGLGGARVCPLPDTVTNREEVSLGLGMDALARVGFRIIALNRKGGVLPRLGCRRLCRVCSCAGTCRTGLGFIKNCLFRSPVVTITAPAAVVPGVKGEAASLLAACTGVFTRSIYTHKHREGGGSGCAMVPAGAGCWQCACCGDRCHEWLQHHLCSLLVVLNPARSRAGLDVGSEPTTGSCLV